MDAEIVLRQQVVLVVPFQGSRGVVDEAIRLKRILDELGIERNVGQAVAVLDPTHQLRSAI